MASITLLSEQYGISIITTELTLKKLTQSLITGVGLLGLFGCAPTPQSNTEPAPTLSLERIYTNKEFKNERAPYFRWLDWLMTANERAGNQVQFYFISDRPAGAIDGSYDLAEPIIQQLMSAVLSRGHHIGLHPSYTTYNDPEQMLRERLRLEQAVRNIDPEYEARKVRQHFLRWSVYETAHHQEAAGFVTDATLGYADAPGFRTGVCYRYQMYDLNRRQPLKIWQEPLVAMEVSVFGKEYLNVENHDAALDILLKLKQNCLRFGGDFRLLWHNNHLVTEADRAVYEQLI